MKTKIEKFLKEMGVCQVGFCKLDMDNPFNLPCAISFAVPLSDAVVDGISDSPTHTYFHHYRTINTFIDNVSLRVGLMLSADGYNYAAVPASQSVEGLQGIFSHKYAAVKSGLGTVGKSGLFLSEIYGPRVRLGTILTNYPFECEKEPLDSVCGDCRLCMESCPAMAISGKEWRPEDEREVIIDAAACSIYMKKAFQHIGRGAVCGICMRVCPYGKRGK